ncbi:MAG: hypothetical protein SVT56_08970 [Chloroflexota bacterium]|jgi:hypothetical protein|nr:hypothetical protein [Chloroflexota bacterium]
MISYSRSAYLQCYQNLIFEKIRELIQEKHLYQKVRIQEKEIRSLISYPETFNHSDTEYLENIQSFLNRQKNKKWKLAGFQNEKDIVKGGFYMGEKGKPVAPDILGYSSPEQRKPHLHEHPQIQDADFIIPNVEIFCDNCTSTKLFSPRDFYSSEGIFYSNQFFFIVFKCQMCNHQKVSFLINRIENYLILVGRSQFNSQAPDPVFPKDNAYLKLISRAKISHDSGGFDIAAISYLRLFIEKYVRDETGILTREENWNISEICEEYAKSIPVKIRDIIPSLKTIYEDLSAAYHEGDIEKREEYGILYEENFELLRNHFHGKKLIDQ